MAIPLVYNFRSVRARWTSAIVAVLGIAGTVGVFVAMLSLARGFKATLVSSGSDDNFGDPRREHPSFCNLDPSANFEHVFRNAAKLNVGIRAR